MNFEELKTYLETQGYFQVVQDPRTGKVYGLMRFIYTIGLVCEIDQQGNYEYRYCYGGLQDVLPAYRDWIARGFSSEPIGYIKRK